MEFCSNILFRSIIEIYPYPIVITDVNNRYVFVNNSFINALGYTTKDAILGRTSHELGIITSLPEGSQLLDLIRQTGYITNIQISVVGPVARTLMCSSKLIRYYEQEYVLTVTVDITKQLTLESERGPNETLPVDLGLRIKELENLRNELECRIEELRSANENLDLLLNTKVLKLKELSNKLVEYININSHEVRAPLARVLGLVKLLRLEPDSSAVLTEKLELSAHELDVIVKKMNRLLQDALD